MDALQEQIYRTLKSEVKRNLIPVISDASKYSLREIGKRTMKVMQFVSNPALLARDMEFAFDERMGLVALPTVLGLRMRYHLPRNLDG